MKSWFQDDRHYNQQITRKTDHIVDSVESCYDLREGHGWNCLFVNVLDRYEQSITSEDMSSNLRAFTAGSVRHFFSLACNVDGNWTHKGEDP